MPQEITAVVLNNADEDPKAEILSLSTSTSTTNDVFDALGAGGQADLFLARGAEKIATATEALTALALISGNTALESAVETLSGLVADIQADSVWFIRS